jgi:hypothetical protein
MHDPNRQLLEEAVRLLRPLLDELVFVGGCATGLLITDPDSRGIRATRDVDTITQISSYAEYAVLSERLRGLGLTEDTEDGVICRWRHQTLIIDVMPTDERILGFSNRWYIPAISSALDVDLATDQIKIIAPEYFLATKLEAFHGRGQGDYGGSHDLEDAIAVIDGRAEIVLEVRDAESDARHYLSESFSALLDTRAFIDALPGFLLPDTASQGRLPLLLSRLRALADAARKS